MAYFSNWYGRSWFSSSRSAWSGKAVSRPCLLSPCKSRAMCKERVYVDLQLRNFSCKVVLIFAKIVDEIPCFALGQLRLFKLSILVSTIQRLASMLIIVQCSRRPSHTKALSLRYMIRRSEPTTLERMSLKKFANPLSSWERYQHDLNDDTSPEGFRQD